MQNKISVGGKNVGAKLLADSLRHTMSWGSGQNGRPFCLENAPRRKEIWRANATAAEMALAHRFRERLAEISPEMEAALTQASGGGGSLIEVPTISDTQINELAEPILKEFGYDIDCIMSQQLGSLSGPAVFDVDLTEPFHEMKEFQIALDLIVHAERLSPKTAYCFPVPRKSDTGAAVVAPLRTWKRMVTENYRGKLVGSVRRAYDSLTSVGGSTAQFDHCRVVHVQSFDEAASNAVPKLQGCALKDDFECIDRPLVIVDGGTVVAALTQDKGDRVVSARVAVELDDSEDYGWSPESSFLPDMNAIIAHVASERALRGEHME